jgi:hypothetical protein
MVGVDDQDGVNGLSRQLRIIGIRMDCVYVVLVSQQRSDSQEYQRQPLNVGGKYLAAFADWRRKFKGKVSRAAPYIGDDTSFSELQCLQDIGGPLPVVSIMLDHSQAVECLTGLIDRAQNGDRQNYAYEKDNDSGPIRLLDLVIRNRHPEHPQSKAFPLGILRKRLHSGVRSVTDNPWSRPLAAFVRGRPAG